MIFLYLIYLTLIYISYICHQNNTDSFLSIVQSDNKVKFDTHLLPKGRLIQFS